MKKFLEVSITFPYISVGFDSPDLGWLDLDAIKSVDSGNRSPVTLVQTNDRDERS
jgi:hypothetical protein